MEYRRALRVEQRSRNNAEKIMRLNARLLVAVAVGAALVALPAGAASITDEWDSVKAPPAPALKSVTVDPKTTALLMLDFMNQNCGKRDRCLAQVPAVKKLLETARAAKVPVVYSFIANTTAADVITDLKPADGEPSVISGPNKFIRTELEKILKDKGITTAIVVGTAANGAVLQTASYAALLGMNVIIPVDGISGDSYAEQYVAWHFTSAPGMTARVTLTKSDMIKF
jgi:nicotinamidase-related amidase